MGKLNGKVAIITGASRGIGRATAQIFAAEGAKVVCAARTLNEGDHMLEGSLQSTVAKIKKSGGTAAAVTVDVSNEESCANLVAETKKLFGPIDVLVNNAAMTYFLPVESFPVKKWIISFAVNFHGPFMLCQKVLPDMKARKKGSIVNVSSGAAIGPGRGPYKGPAPHGSTLYGAEKAALERFTQGLAEEVYGYGISVTCVSPSNLVPTPGTIYHKLATGMDDPRGEPQSMMGNAILLLATEPLDKVTGRVTYSQAILKEFGWIKEGKGLGIDRKGSGYSLV
ncbi:MAG: SDR family NAD(P)-dependent oxidoreductase [Dehalococcoidales bacterium]|nr:SDR family NAD(P)-dependent oxidoreductase [Dehalococcoidales bacterium]